jgi:D-3-phosphoglycerate dehydrogenase
MSKSILLSAPYMIPIYDRFRHHFENANIEVVLAEVIERLSEADLLRYAGQIDGTICGDDKYTEEVLKAFSPRLKVISKWGTGIDSIDQNVAKRLEIKVFNTPGAFTQPVADTVMEYILMFARKGPWLDQAVRTGSWQKIPGRALNECTLGVVGVGNIGKAVLRRAKAFGMQLLGNDVVEISKPFIEESGVKMTKLDDLLGESDFISLNCDLNPSSYQLIDQEAFTKTKPGSVIINTSRGAVVDENALITALRVGRLSGAALDVYEDEPLPSDSPLLDIDNVLLGSHNANSSPKAWERVHRNTLRNLFLGLGIEFSLPEGKGI